MSGERTGRRILVLRPATLADAGLLLDWRNDPLTREASVHGEKISEAEHQEWLESSLKNRQRRILIAELDGVPVGTLRTDERSDASLELSWTVSPEKRGVGLGKAFVSQAAESLEGLLVSRIKPGNAASVRIAEAAGLRLCGEEDGLLVFRRPAKGCP